MLPKKKENKKKNNLHGLLISSSALLKKSGIQEAELEAQLLLAWVLKKNRAYLLSHLDEYIKDIYSAIFFKFLKKRLKGWSLAVIFKSKSFYKADFFVNENVLIPRPETEVMVENIIKEAKKGDFIFDIGTGSGAIICSLANELKDNNYFYASDKSLKALNVATINIRKQNLNIKLLQGDLLKPYLKILEKYKPCKFIIAANLPYLNPEEMKEPSIKKEPVSSLSSGFNGLWHYQRLFSQLANYLKTNAYKASVSVYCEINPAQKEDIKSLALKYFTYASVNFQQDLNNQVRLCLINIEHHSNCR